MARLSLLLAAALVSAATIPDFFLPGDVVPLDYSIDLRIDPARPAFDGVARIAVDIKATTATVWLNAKDLTIAGASIERAGHEQRVRVITTGGEFLGLESDRPLGPGRAVLSISYRGQLSQDTTVGAFRKRIGSEWFVFTTFTPVDARRAFPCFDEPRFKTPWTLTIRARRGHQAYANAPAASTRAEPGGWKAVRFAATKPLPSELVAFAVGAFERLDGGRVGQAATPVGVITPPGLQEQGGEAVRATQRVLPLLEAYTGIPYPFQKLDHIALPEGAFGATENPGLITYIQDRLLVEPGKATAGRVRALRRLQAHEIAHQWFGNLVTQSAWRDVWLSEGFATWLSERIMDEEEPPGRRRLRAIAARERIMQADASDRAVPVRRELKSREEMMSVYNRFVYQKGAAVLLMLEAWLGDSAFRNSTRAYLVNHSFSTATTADFAGALLAVTKTDTSPVLSSFLDQTGVPVLRVDTVCDSGKAPRLRVELPSGKKWAIPLCWRAGTAESACALVESPRGEINLPPGSTCPPWVYPNAHGAGYYRVDWTAERLSALPVAQLTAAERLTLVYDLQALKRAKALPATGDSVLTVLASDPEPEISTAAREALGKAAAR